MFANLTSSLDFHSKALLIRAERQRVSAGNIVNADTPGYAARNLDFKEAMASANEPSHGALSLTPSKSSRQEGFLASSNTKHMALPGNSEGRLGGQEKLGYVIQSQPSLDGNSVDLDQERANFVDNSVHYEATLRFINGQSKTILSAIQGQ